MNIYIGRSSKGGRGILGGGGGILCPPIPCDRNSESFFNRIWSNMMLVVLKVGFYGSFKVFLDFEIFA